MIICHLTIIFVYYHHIQSLCLYIFIISKGTYRSKLYAEWSEAKNFFPKN